MREMVSDFFTTPCKPETEFHHETRNPLIQIVIQQNYLYGAKIAFKRQTSVKL